MLFIVEKVIMSGPKIDPIECVLAVASLRCIGGKIYTKLLFDNNEQIERAKDMEIISPKKIYQINDFVSGDFIFYVIGITVGN